MIFPLVQDFADAFSAMPREHPRYRILKLLDEAIRRDVHFIDRHPTTFFQCMWNSCWWYDCPDLKEFYAPAEVKKNEAFESPDKGPMLFLVLEQWRREKEDRTPGFQWLRST